jgi:hypothetical protein
LKKSPQGGIKKRGAFGGFAAQKEVKKTFFSSYSHRFYPQKSPLDKTV